MSAIKLLSTNLASLSQTGEYWPLVVFDMYGPRFAQGVLLTTTLGQYSPAQPSRSVSKRLVFLTFTYRTNYRIHNDFSNCSN